MKKFISLLLVMLLALIMLVSCQPDGDDTGTDTGSQTDTGTGGTDNTGVPSVDEDTSKDNIVEF